MAGFPSLDDLKAHLNLTKSVNDDELLLMLDAASELVTSLVGSFDAADVTEVVTVNNGTVVLGRIPTGEVLLSYSDSVPVTGFVTNAEAGLLRGVPVLYGTLTASYPAGGEVPAAVALSILIIAAHLFETQRGPAAVGPLTAEEDPAAVAGLGYAIPSRARELLAPYAWPRIA